MWLNRILIAGALTVGVVATGWAQQRANPTNTNPAATQQSGTGADAAAQTPAQSNLTGQTTSGINANVGTDATSMGSIFIRATQVVGIEVRESTGQARIGQIADLLLTSNTNVATTTGINAATAANANVAANTNTGAAGANAEVEAGIGVNGVPAYVTGPLARTNGSAWWQSNNDVRFALIQIDNATADRVVVIPWELLQFQGAYFILGLPESRIAEAPSVMLNDPRILQNAQWLDQVGTFFANDLQQIQGQIGVQGQTGVNAAGATTPNAATPATTTTPGAATTPDSQRPASRTTTTPQRSTRRGTGTP